MKISNYIILLLAFISCQTQDSIPKEVSDYLVETLDLLEANSVNKNKIDWKEFKIDVFKKVQNAKNIEDTYPAISYAIKKLDDNHSYFKPTTETETNSENKSLPVLFDETTPNDIGYIRIPFCIGTEDNYNDYISTISTKIEEQSKKKLKGWIIDLRGNFGGNMWPMLLSIEPLIGNGTLGYFVNSDNQHQAWKLNKGKVYIDNELIFENKLYEKLDLSKPFLAVLIDSRTASSGEAIVVAHQLSDGSTINLAESIFTDKKMNKYGLSIYPDVVIEENKTLKAGIDWIYEMNINYR